ncbi:MAG: hypothetical protein NZT92_09635 [Abditibacteriales bacterium]|nr:hypothetical protein [Abditibacteriales bacterium]MDW8367128.1 hypothetical protein [Abditibacteriales bacterium]
MTTHGAWYNIFLPKNYNDGRPIELEKFDAIITELSRQFGGMTAFDKPVFTIQGAWMGLGFLQREDILIYGVFAHDINAARPFFDEAAVRWKSKEWLDQEAILMTEMIIEVMVK